MTCSWIHWNFTKIFLARKWNSAEDKPVIDRARGFIVTKIKICKMASFAGAAPWFQGLGNHVQEVGLQKGSRENVFFPCEGAGPFSGCGPAVWKWDVNSLRGDLSPTILLGVKLRTWECNFINLGRKWRLSVKNLTFEKLSENWKQ